MTNEEKQRRKIELLREIYAELKKSNNQESRLP